MSYGCNWLNIYNTCPKNGGLETIDDTCLGLMRKDCLFGSFACLEGLFVWKVCLFGRPACLEGLLVWKTDRQTDRQMDRQTDRQSDLLKLLAGA